MEKATSNNELVSAVLSTYRDGSLSVALASDAISSTASVIATITSCVVQYTGSQVPPGDAIYTEMASVFCRFYKSLSIQEIRTVFRIGAAGLIPGLTSDSFRAFHGVFTVSNFSTIFSLYLEYRASAVKEVNAIQDVIDISTNEDSRRAYWLSDEGVAHLLQMKTERIEQLFAYSDLLFSHVHERDFDTFVELGLITFENLPVELRWDYMLIAQKAVKIQLQDSLRSDPIRNSSLRSLLDAVCLGYNTDDFDIKCRSYAKRYSVYRFILNSRA